jgi:branched-chain amino acid transport system substrate-binding protein
MTRGCALAAAVLAALVCDAPAGAPAAAAELKLGATLSLTGATDDYGRAARMGLELAVAEYNAKGGYRGAPIALAVYDDETKPAKGVENVGRLIGRDHVFAIVGPVNSGVALAIIDLAQKHRVVLMDTIATAEPIVARYQGAPRNYIFRVSLNDGVQTAIMLDHAHRRQRARIGLLHDSTGWGQSGRDTVLRLLKPDGLALAGEPEVFDAGDTDLRAPLARLRDGAAQFLITYALAPAAVEIARSLRALGWSVPWSGTWGLGAPNFLRLGGATMVEGVMAVTSYTPDQSAAAKALHAKIDRAFRDEGGDFHPVATAQTYDGARLLLRALDKVGPDPEMIRDALEQIDDFTTAVTRMTAHPFSMASHEALGRAAGYLAVWHAGRLVPAD